jgi:GT2 family glycosyltransferase
VVDNGSSDGTDEVCSAWPEIEVVLLPTNVGFAPAVNHGISRCADLDVVAVLNNDAVAEPGWLAAGLTALAADERCAAVSSLMLRADDLRQVDSAGIRFSWLRGAADLGSGELRDWWAEPREILAACAGAAFYRRFPLEEVGGFAPDFFAYFEDVDLGFRLRAAGWTAAFAPAAVVHHVGGATLGRYSERQLRLWTANAVRVLVRNMPLPVLLRHLPALCAQEAAHLLRCVRRGHARAWVEGVTDLWRARHQLADQRASVLSAARWSMSDLEAAIALNPGPRR